MSNTTPPRKFSAIEISLWLLVALCMWFVMASLLPDLRPTSEEAHPMCDGGEAGVCALP